LHDLAHTVDNLLDYVLSEASLASHSSENVSISSLMGDLSPFIEGATRSKSLALEVDVNAAPAIVYLPRRALRSIISNLLLNAIKFTEHGTVRLSISTSSLSTETPALVIVLSDTGVGMTAALIKQAVSTFADLSNTAPRPHRGLGFGLAVAQRHMSTLCASFAIDSTPGQGSVFRVHIPLPPCVATAA
jgi:signal transduction histidine kinase